MFDVFEHEMATGTGPGMSPAAAHAVNHEAVHVHVRPLQPRVQHLPVRVLT